jgi:hypothetical protein
MRTLKNVIFSLIPTIVLLGLLEVAARLIGQPNKTAPNQVLQDIYNQKSVEGIRSNIPVSAQLNTYGFRGREFNFAKKSDEYVIVVVGGSVATGAWASSFQNAPAQALEVQLSEHIKTKFVTT